MDFTLYWLGESESESGLELTDVFVASTAPKVGLSYATEEESTHGTVTITQESDGPAPNTNCPPSAAEEEEVTVRGQKAVLATVEIPGYGLSNHCLKLKLDGTALEVSTVVSYGDGRDRNQFNNREAILALAEALEPAE